MKRSPYSVTLYADGLPGGCTVSVTVTAPHRGPQGPTSHRTATRLLVEDAGRALAAACGEAVEEVPPLTRGIVTQ